MRFYMRLSEYGRKKVSNNFGDMKLKKIVSEHYKREIPQNSF